jgi:hypothetical protein
VHDLGPLLLESNIDLIHEFLSDYEVLVKLDVPIVKGEDGQVLGEDASLYGLNYGLFESVAEKCKIFVVVELCSVLKTSCPSVDRGDWVSRGSLSLLILSVVSGDCSMSSFSFQYVVGVKKDRGHESEGTKSLSDNIGLYITIVVLAGPDDSSITLECLSNHIIDKSVLVVDSLGNKLILELLLVSFFKNVLEKTIILLENGVLGGKLEWHFSVKSVSHARLGKGLNGSLSVEHTQVA